MHTFIKSLKPYAPSVLRIGMSLVILWFSSQQFLHTQVWTAYVPDSAVALTHQSAITLVYINAAFEAVFGLLLLFGIWTRFAAFLLVLHLLDIMWIVGYGEIGVRDFGLAVATFVVFMNGPDEWCMQQAKKAVQ